MAKPKTLLPEFADGLRGELLVDEPMSRHTSWRTGGNADYFYTPADKADLKQLMILLPNEIQINWVGLGSNLLIRDAGIRGIVIRTSKGLNNIELLGEGKLYAESGVPCAKVARNAARNNLKGLEFLAGVPGSFGGALAMNAGAFGGETWERVLNVECIDRNGRCVLLDAENIDFGYRRVDLPEGHWILSGVLGAEIAEDSYDSKDKIRSLLDKRNTTQPIKSANAGSVFRNPEGDYAARLIETAGLKGTVSGDAIISDVHANFILNRGNATSKDIENLIYVAKEAVINETGIDLDLEVRILGDES